MRTCVKSLILLLTCAGFLAVPALALGPVDGEFGAVWWDNDFDSSGGAVGMSSDAGAPGYRAELWFIKKVGVRAGIYSSDLDELGVDSSDYASLDVMWRAFSPTENNFFAMGGGWQEMDLASIGLDGDTSGARLSLEGRFGLPLLYIYGQASYLPQLDDAPASDPALGRFEDLSGHEIELGVSWKIFPFTSLRAGYRTQSVEFTRTGFTPLPTGETEMDGEAGSEGFLVGLTLRF